jgi:hypothetical protein
MTPEEFQYLKRAVEALESGEHSEMSQVKILRTVEQICGRSAIELEHNLVDEVDIRLYNSNTKQRSEHA